MNEDKILLSHAADLERIADKTGRPGFTSFLTEEQAAVIHDAFPSARFCGGYEGAMRTVAGFSGDYELTRDMYPVRGALFSGRGIDDLTHRDFLGALMSLGIERDLIGDIFHVTGGVCVFVLAQALPLVLDMAKIGRTGVSVRELPPDDEIHRTDRFEDIPATVASLRLDCIVAVCARTSREKASSLITQGYVRLDHRDTGSTSAQVHQGAVISVRGHGRFVLSEVGGTTKKDRTRILIKKYI